MLLCLCVRVQLSAGGVSESISSHCTVCVSVFSHILSQTSERGPFFCWHHRTVWKAAWKQIQRGFRGNWHWTGSNLTSVHTWSPLWFHYMLFYTSWIFISTLCCSTHVMFYMPFTAWPTWLSEVLPLPDSPSLTPVASWTSSDLWYESSWHE